MKKNLGGRMGVCLLAVGLAASGLAGAAEPAGALFPIVLDGKWGYMDGKGNTVVPPQYRGAEPFSEGRGLVRTDSSDKPYACLDAAGKVAFYLDPNWEYMERFSEGLASLKDSKADKYGYIDKSGKVAIPFQFSSATSFSEGLAAVEFYDGSKMTFGVINPKGELVIPADANRKESFSDGLAAVRVWGADGSAKFGFINHSGAIVIPPKYKKVGRFSEGLAFVWDGQKLEIIDKAGAAVAALPFKVGEYDSMPVFSSGFAAPPIGWRTQEDKTWGFIDKKGQLVFTNIGLWSIRTPFSEGLAWVYLGGDAKEAACIDTQGKVLFKVANFEDAREFKNGLSPVKIKGQNRVLYYDSKGNVLPK